MALRALRQGNTGIRVLQETKLNGGVHTQQNPGYTVWATEEESRHQGGVSVVWRDAEGWGFEGVWNFGPNVVSFIITLGRKRWYGVRSYVPPNNLPMINWIRQALDFRPKGMGKFLVGNLNACLENPRDQREEQLATVLARHGLTDHAQHFSPRWKYRAEGNWTWRMWMEERPISVQGDYILGIQDDFSMVGLQEPRTPTDHPMVLGVLFGDGVTRHRAYVKGRTNWPI